MLRYCCLGLAHIRHATIVDVVFDFHTYVMLLYCYVLLEFHTSCYATGRCLGLPHLRRATLCSLGLPRMRYLSFLRAAVNKRRLKNRENELVGGL